MTLGIAGRVQEEAVRTRRQKQFQRQPERRETMKRFVSVLAAVVLFVVVSAPAFAQTQAPKGTEGPDIRKVEPKGTEGPDIRKQAPKKSTKKSKKGPTAATKAKVEPKGTEGPDIRKVEPKGTEGPDIRKVEPKGTEGPDIRKKGQ
jgi:hypothetical protein